MTTTAFQWLIQTRESINSAGLYELIVRYGVMEIDVINSEGYIIATTYPAFMGFDMRSGEQSAELMALLQGQDEYAKSCQPVSYGASISRKYGGVVRKNGGFVQVG